MKRVFVLDANQRSALAVTRSLGKHKIPVITADETQTSLAGCSRYSQQYVVYPSPLIEPEQFASAIIELCTKLNIDIVLPMTELTTTLLQNHRASLTRTILPFADIKKIDALSNKCSLMRLAQSVNVPIPKTWFVDSLNNLPVDLEHLTYPVVLKPVKSWLQLNGKWLHTSVRIAENSVNAAEILASDPSFYSHQFMIQQYVPGTGGGVFMLYDQGTLLATFAHRRLREKPPRGGLSVLSESTIVDSTLESYARKILDHVGWHGVAMVEFRITPEGKAYLMEINTRFWGSLQLAVDAGVDFPWLLYQITSNKHIIPVLDYTIGTRLRWILGDIDSLYLVLRDSEYSLKKKLDTIIAFLTPSPCKTRHEVNRCGDIGPFWWELKHYLQDLLR